MISMKKRISAVLTATILIANLAVPAMTAEALDKPIQVSGYPGG